MPRDNYEVVDLVVRRPDGRLRLVITDSVPVTDDDKRSSLLIGKVRAYAAYVAGPEFAAAYPGKSARDCEITVTCPVAPSARLQAAVEALGRDEAGVGMPVSFEVLDRTDNRTKDSAAAPVFNSASAAAMLFQATVGNNLLGVMAAVAIGADINAVNPVGNYPLDFAVYHGNKELVEWLFAQGARLPPDSNGGRTLWISANANRSGEIKELLVAQGVRPRPVDHLLTLFVRWKRRGKAK